MSPVPQAVELTAACSVTSSAPDDRLELQMLWPQFTHGQR
jgi:hypothetical protein